MFHIALFEPEIPPNTGAIMRLCANTGCQLELIHPLGFQLDEKRVKRAGMDYRDMAVVHEYQSYNELLTAMPSSKVFALTTKATSIYADTSFQAGDILLFGPESRGLPETVLDSLPEEQKLRLPMLADSRSLNLANTVSIVVYEALRQQGFKGLR